MLRTIAVNLVLLIGALLVYAATRANIFQLYRSVSIRAPADKICLFINYLHSWKAASPYQNMDPAMQQTFSGAASGPGAVYEWSGNSKVGQGRIEITDAVPSRRVAITLDMLKPIEGHKLVQFTLQPAGDATQVSWAMQGPVPYLGKIVHLLFNMDRLLGGRFERGLASLKAVAER